MEGMISFGGSSHGQVANTDIHTYYIALGLCCGVYSFNFQGDQQVELLVGLIVPELGGIFKFKLIGLIHLEVYLWYGNMLICAI